MVLRQSKSLHLDAFNYFKCLRIVLNFRLSSKLYDLRNESNSITIIQSSILFSNQLEYYTLMRSALSLVLQHKFIYNIYRAAFYMIKFYLFIRNEITKVLYLSLSLSLSLFERVLIVKSF